MFGFDFMQGPPTNGFRFSFFWGGGGYRTTLFVTVFGKTCSIFFPEWFAGSHDMDWEP